MRSAPSHRVGRPARDPVSNLGRELEAFRARAGLDLARWAEALGITPESYRRYRRGQVAPWNPAALRALAREIIARQH